MLPSLWYHDHPRWPKETSNRWAGWEWGQGTCRKGRVAGGIGKRGANLTEMPRQVPLCRRWLRQADPRLPNEVAALIKVPSRRSLTGTLSAPFSGCLPCPPRCLIEARAPKQEQVCLSRALPESANEKCPLPGTTAHPVAALPGPQPSTPVVPPWFAFWSCPVPSDYSAPGFLPQLPAL